MPETITLSGLPTTLYTNGVTDYSYNSTVTIPTGPYVSGVTRVVWSESAGPLDHLDVWVNGPFTSGDRAWTLFAEEGIGFDYSETMSPAVLADFNNNAPGTVSVYVQAFGLDGGTFTPSIVQFILLTQADIEGGGSGGSGGGGGSGGSGGGSGGINTGTGSVGSSPGLCLLKFTRANMRDEIRLMMGITPPIQYIQGAVAGEEPYGEHWPGNLTINTAIANAIRNINLRTGFHTSHVLTVSVPAYTGVGPQWIPLQGIGAGPYQNLINDVERAVWFDGTTYTRLKPRSFWDMDRNRYDFDNETPDTPDRFGIHAYQLGLLPGAATAGTLQLWAGTGLIGFCDDTDVMDELSLDEQLVIEHEAVKLLRMMRPDEENATDQIQLYGAESERGVKKIQRDLAERSAMEQSSLSYSSRRRRRWV